MGLILHLPFTKICEALNVIQQKTQKRIRFPSLPLLQASFKNTQKEDQPKKPFELSQRVTKQRPQGLQMQPESRLALAFNPLQSLGGERISGSESHFEPKTEEASYKNKYFNMRQHVKERDRMLRVLIQQGKQKLEELNKQVAFLQQKDKKSQRLLSMYKKKVDKDLNVMQTLGQSLVSQSQSFDKKQADLNHLLAAYQDEWETTEQWLDNIYSISF